ncbi:MAG: hypothetical protein EA376_01510 [Phycisphaeraceae bacterium]|nr:MAG: hypothetical protein EA376_01510 [Phycisphaeraceae bacterium]
MGAEDSGGGFAAGFVALGGGRDCFEGLQRGREGHRGDDFGAAARCGLDGGEDAAGVGIVEPGEELIEREIVAAGEADEREIAGEVVGEELLGAVDGLGAGCREVCHDRSEDRAGL